MSIGKRPSLVQQVREQLLDEVAEGRLVEGDKLPNEYELAEHFEVSRATVREAILGLLESGRLARFRGTGTFVAAEPPRHSLDATVSYTAMIRDAGKEPGETVLNTIMRPPTEPEQTRLSLPAEETLVEIERIRSGDGRPLIYSRDRIPQALLGDLEPEMLGSSLYVALESAEHKVLRATARLAPTVADERLSGLLETSVGTPLLHIEQVDYDSAGRAVMLSDEWHVADAFELVVNRRARIEPGSVRRLAKRQSNAFG
jgi:DNA-binding GntR family transcriptional regulator